MRPEVQEALELHKKMLDGDEEGRRFSWSKVEKYFSHDDSLRCVDLSGADLRQANLEHVDLREAILASANLEGANLSYANLSDAILSNANLAGSNMRKTILRRAILKYSNLEGANLADSDLKYASLFDTNLSDARLQAANLTEVSLVHANLTDANLIDAILTDADLSGANLKNVFLYDANLSGALLSQAKNLDTVRYGGNTAFFAMQCPEEGSYIGFKVAEDKIVKLEIPADALRSSATSRKCRASKAKVLSITELDGFPSNVDFVVSDHDNNFIYKVGETVEVKDFDPNRWDECSTGIHHFITRGEAADYLKKFKRFF